MVIPMSKSRRSAAKRVRFPRRFWHIKPFDRIHESKKLYNRQRLKQGFAREIDEMWGLEVLTMRRKVVIQKVDMDTALTAYLLEISPGDHIVVVRDKASPKDLADPDVICIECGGSGQTHLGNFDHHDTDQPLPPACVQAFRLRFGPEEKGKEKEKDNERLERLVEYVSALDTQGPEGLKQRLPLPKGAFPTLSDVFSGMLLVTKDPKEQLLRGIEICRRVLQEELDPFGQMPELEEWKAYLEAKRQNKEAIQKALKKARFFETKGGLKAGFVETNVIGVLGALYDLGCQIALAYSPRFGTPPVPKYTIAGNGVRVDSLLKILNEKEEGWGGPAHGTIIGSPRVGSRLRPEEVIALLREYL